MGLDGQVAVISGAGRGIGRGEALALAREGAAVALLARTAADLMEVAREIEDLGGEALTVECDVRDRSQVDEAVQRTIDRFGRVDILVNNAQAIAHPHPLETWTEEEVRLMWESGYLGSWNLMQACFPHMKAREYGRIINTCSATGYANLPGFSAYADTKEAIRSLTRDAAREWGAHNITANAISPAVLSPALEQLYPDEASRQELLSQINPAIRRFGDAEQDVGRTLVFLCGPDAAYITGCTLSVDGGISMVV